MAPYPAPHDYRALVACPGTQARQFGRILQKRLDGEGEVAVSPDAAGAFRIIQRYHVAVALISSTLRGRIGGDVLIAAIKQDPELSSTRLIALLGEDEKALIRKYEILQCDSILVGPLDEHRFFEAMGKYLHISYRRHRRVTVRMPVVLEHGGETGEGETVDLSISGVRLTSSMNLQEGDAVTLLLHVPDGRTVGPIPGTVKRHEDGNTYGISFGSLSQDDLLRIEYLILEYDRAA